MKSTIFRKSLFFSALSHLAVFGLIGLSFGNKAQLASYGDISFWGDVFSVSVSQGFYDKALKAQKIIPFEHYLFLDKKTSAGSASLNTREYIKPAFYLTFNDHKKDFSPAVKPAVFTSNKKGAVVMFHPWLPYTFSLYFADRQVAHVELMFNITSDARKSSLMVKRRITSGNPEVDLLTIRYISRYLFIKQSAFMPDKWQTVKIDLSAKE